MAKVIGINGSPRKHNNSALLLEEALKSAKAQGAETELIHLKDLNFSGCASCFGCKRIGGKSYGRCALRDDLTRILSSIVDDGEVTAVIFSMPIYFGDVPGMVRDVFERLWFPGLLYDKEGKIAYDKKTKVGLIYTMNCPDPSFYDGLIGGHKHTMEWLIGEAKSLCVFDTLQYDDYSKYAGSMFNVEAKLERHEKHFPLDLEEAAKLGSWAVEK